MRSMICVLLLLVTFGACTCKQDMWSMAAGNQARAEAIGVPTKIAVIGDFGVADANEAAVSALVHSWKPDFIITVGDNNYPHGKRDTFDANIGAFYHDYIRFDAAYAGPYKSAGSVTQRFFPALGNHDWYSGEGDRPHADYFDLPGNERYYTTHLGPAVDLFVLDSDDHEPDGNDMHSKQAQWLHMVLAASRAPWKLVTMHHPPYSRGEHGDTLTMQWPYRLWGASAVLAGHDHDYERIVFDDFPYWVVGTGGAALRGFNDRPYSQAQADIMYEHKHGAMLMEATPEALTSRFITRDHEIIDSYELKRRP